MAKELTRFIKNFLRAPVRVTKYYLFDRVGQTDYERWSQIENLRPEWDARTRQIASLVSPGSRVIEFGAGRQSLKDFLPSNCQYQGSDLVARDEHTIVCDLNQAFPTLDCKYDYAVFSGVLEYVLDVAQLVRNLKPHAAKVIASYAVRESCPDYVARRTHGWVNHYAEAEFVDLFAQGGYTLIERQVWDAQIIFVFADTGTQST